MPSVPAAFEHTNVPDSVNWTVPSEPTVPEPTVARSRPVTGRTHIALVWNSIEVEPGSRVQVPASGGQVRRGRVRAGHGGSST